MKTTNEIESGIAAYFLVLPLWFQKLYCHLLTLLINLDDLTAVTGIHLIGPILDDKLKEKILKP